MNVRRVVAALAAVLAGCSDNGPSNRAGSVSFGYTGGPRSPYSATGAMPLAEEAADNSSWAVGLHDPEQGTLIFSQRVNAGGIKDIVFIGVDRLTTGTSDIATDNCTESVCAGMALLLDGGSGALCSLADGSVSVTEVSSSRMKGEFSGTGYCLVLSENPDSPSPDSLAFTATAGTFDVFLQVDQILGARRSAAFRLPRSP